MRSGKSRPAYLLKLSDARRLVEEIINPDTTDEDRKCSNRQLFRLLDDLERVSLNIPENKFVVSQIRELIKVNNITEAS